MTMTSESEELNRQAADSYRRVDPGQQAGAKLVDSSRVEDRRQTRS